MRIPRLLRDAPQVHGVPSQIGSEVARYQAQLGSADSAKYATARAGVASQVSIYSAGIVGDDS